ncbi:protein of unknown function [Candidatus Methylomirabilis oxygeniifera]|uniref:Uncharacterized protein n=1 Tax=Methylomirabilis oxygeniifera TaxID=671143 RepID=D5MF49_METO1|nr:protein of unknown function [Candidatus Methylomirabilis oxyfera]
MSKGNVNGKAVINSTTADAEGSRKMAFTVEFDNQGNITEVYEGGVSKGMGRVIHPHHEKKEGENIPKGMRANLDGKSVENITSVTIVTTTNPTICLIQGGKLYCFPKP